MTRILMLVILVAPAPLFAQDAAPPPAQPTDQQPPPQQQQPPPATTTSTSSTSSSGMPHGTYTPPGKFFVTVNPLGVSLTLSSAVFPFFKVGLNFGGKVASLGQITLWLGGELNVGGRENFVLVEPGFFVMITMEKLLHIPLVPFVRGGIAGGALIVFNTGGATGTGGALWVKVGGGLHYFVHKNIGIGGETNFGFGPGFATDAANNLVVGFSGYWEFLLGMRAHF
jgi:hypothetical protein